MSKTSLKLMGGARVSFIYVAQATFMPGKGQNRPLMGLPTQLQPDDQMHSYVISLMLSIKYKGTFRKHREPEGDQDSEALLSCPG